MPQTQSFISTNKQASSQTDLGPAQSGPRLSLIRRTACFLGYLSTWTTHSIKNAQY